MSCYGIEIRELKMDSQFVLPGQPLESLFGSGSHFHPSPIFAKELYKGSSESNTPAY